MNLHILWSELGRDHSLIHQPKLREQENETYYISHVCSCLISCYDITPYEK